MPVFFIKTSDLKDKKVIISGLLFNHLKNALRYKIDDVIHLVDENRTAYHAAITRMTDQFLEGSLTCQEKNTPSSVPRLILAPAFIKRKKMELLLQKGTELGIREIIPLTTARTVIQPHEERLDHQRERWQKILVEAAQQSEQSSPPLLHDPVEFKTFIKQHGTGIGFIFWEKGTKSLKQTLSNLPNLSSVTPITVVIGPEGGFDQNEIDLAVEKGYISVSLGKPILRSETAVMAAITLLQYELGYFGT
ncbi:MAG: 16S rRNA (uracil(1498)-N(3))-methyltransferase [Nitrospirae bacterium]|nr:16S rRNA (uracil(1498)-N(3))-methyltransferase [Nitrospirota bacterium]